MTQAEKERLAKVGKTFNAKTYISKEIEAIRAQVGDRKVLLAMSGGVDSSVCAVLLHQAIGKQLTCVFVDHGCMRLNEGKEIKKIFKGKFGINLICVEAEKRFLDKTAGVTDPEQKRKIIGAEFVRVFEEEAKKLGKVDFLATVVEVLVQMLDLLIACEQHEMAAVTRRLHVVVDVHLAHLGRHVGGHLHLFTGNAGHFSSLQSQ